MMVIARDTYMGGASWQAECGCIGHGFADAYEVEIPCADHSPARA